jgi:DNA-binding transcriptional regulator YiaG
MSKFDGIIAIEVNSDDVRAIQNEVGAALERGEDLCFTRLGIVALNMRRSLLVSANRFARRLAIEPTKIVGWESGEVPLEGDEARRYVEAVFPDDPDYYWRHRHDAWVLIVIRSTKSFAFLPVWRRKDNAATAKYAAELPLRIDDDKGGA